MGVQILSKGVDAENFAVEYAAPVTRGLQGIFFLNGTLEKCARNYAANKPNGSIVGIPTLGANFLTCKGSTNFVQTGISESESMTMFVVARSPLTGTPAPADFPHWVSNFSSSAVEGSGVMIYPPDAGRVTASTSHGNDAASNINLSAAVGPVVVNAFSLHSSVHKLGSTTSLSHTAGVTSTSTSALPRRVSSRKMRIGSGYSSSQQGLVDVAAVFIYNVELTATEIAIVAADIKAYAARKGITV